MPTTQQSSAPSYLTTRRGRVRYAPAGRRWAARLIDAALVAAATAAGYAASTSENSDPNDALAIPVLFLGSVVILGILYGIGYSPGQLLARVKSRRSTDGRVIGPIRGTMRYLSVAFFPLVLYLFFVDNTDSPWSGRVIVTRRRTEDDSSTAWRQVGHRSVGGHAQPSRQSSGPFITSGE